MFLKSLFKYKVNQRWICYTHIPFKVVGVHPDSPHCVFFVPGYYRSHRIMDRKNFSLNLPMLNLIPPKDSFPPSLKVERPLTPSPIQSPFSSPPESPKGNPPTGLVETLKQQIRICVSKRGTKTSVMRIDEDMKEFCHLFLQLNAQEKQEVILFMANYLAINHLKITELVEGCPNAKDSENKELQMEKLIRWEDKLRQNLQPPYHWFAVQISRLSGGVKFLVDLRESLLLTLVKLPSENQSALKTFDSVLRELLALWFAVGLLQIQRITWSSPCNLLEKISAYEAVHPMKNWLDLKRRVGTYRRCFTFTHSCMPNEPLVILHTYLTDKISDNMKNIVESPRSSPIDSNNMIPDEDPNEIAAAVFYSITSTHNGLKGIELGNYLIKRVVKEIQSEFPHVKQYSSLSPIPGFVKWIDSYLTKGRRGEVKILTNNEISKLLELFDVVTEPDLYAELKRVLKINSWNRNESLTEILQPVFMRLCAYYLYQEKRRGYAFNSVANFHLKNGAVLWRINWEADKSPGGISNSCGIMVNYRYFLENCEDHSREYLETGRIYASDTVTELASTCRDVFTS